MTYESYLRQSGIQSSGIFTAESGCLDDTARMHAPFLIFSLTQLKVSSGTFIKILFSFGRAGHANNFDPKG